MKAERQFLDTKPNQDLFTQNSLAQQNIMLALNQVHCCENGERLEQKHATILNEIVLKLVDLAAAPDNEESLHDMEIYSLLCESIIALDRIENG